MLNQYKRTDVFRCRHLSHRDFENRVSVYHVLKEKKCYPEGCMQFLWRCQMLNKGGSCPKGYHHVGRNCFSCKWYYDEKMHCRPEVILSHEEGREFWQSYRDFEDWLSFNQNRQVEFSGKVNSVKPHFRKLVSSRENSLRLLGFLLGLNDGFIGRTGFDTDLYVNISLRFQERHRIAVDDDIEGLAILTEDRGRLILARPRRLEFNYRSNGETLTPQQAIVAFKTGRELSSQPEECLSCRWGVLVDKIEREERLPGKRRTLFCLRGVANPEECPFLLASKLESSGCILPEKIESKILSYSP